MNKVRAISEAFANQSIPKIESWSETNTPLHSFYYDRLTGTVHRFNQQCFFEDMGKN